MRVLIGHEQFGHMRTAFRARGHDAWSCDLMPTRDGSPYHLQCDVLTVLDDGWDLGIFHPDCTYLTHAAEWAYGDGPYHQKLKPETLVGAARREARELAIAHVFALRDCRIPKKAIENPRGILSTRWRKPDQTVHPYWFGHDASKATCWWLEGGGAAAGADADDRAAHGRRPAALGQPDRQRTEQARAVSGPRDVARRDLPRTRGGLRLDLGRRADGPQIPASAVPHRATDAALIFRRMTCH